MTCFIDKQNTTLRRHLFYNPIGPLQLSLGANASTVLKPQRRQQTLEVALSIQTEPASVHLLAFPPQVLQTIRNLTCIVSGTQHPCAEECTNNSHYTMNGEAPSAKPSQVSPCCMLCWWNARGGAKRMVGYSCTLRKRVTCLASSWMNKRIPAAFPICFLLWLHNEGAEGRTKLPFESTADTATRTTM